MVASDERPSYHMGNSPAIQIPDRCPRCGNKAMWRLLQKLVDGESWACRQCGAEYRYRLQPVETVEERNARLLDQFAREKRERR